MLGTKVYPVTKNMFLEHPNDWDPNFANFSAKRIGVVLSKEHWDWINLLQRYRREFIRTPIEKAFINYAKRKGYDTVRVNVLFKRYANLVKTSGLSRLNCGCIG